jgi:hypothetical protein
MPKDTVFWIEWATTSARTPSSARCPWRYTIEAASAGAEGASGAVNITVANAPVNGPPLAVATNPSIKSISVRIVLSPTSHLCSRTLVPAATTAIGVHPVVVGRRIPIETPDGLPGAGRSSIADERQPWSILLSGWSIAHVLQQIAPATIVSLDTRQGWSIATRQRCAP